MINIEKVAETILIIFATLIITYNLITTAGTECYDKLSMLMSIFVLAYTIFMRII